MSTFLLTLLCAILFSADGTQQTETPRKPNPFAPSLPLLTDEEEERFDQIIDRFIDYDTGKLRGTEARQALSEFQKLEPESIPALIRGLNRAARIEHSCPAVTIAKKLSRMLSSTRDAELLEFARENIGAGITQSRHMGVIKELRVVCMLRKRAIDPDGQTALRSAPALRGDSYASPRPKKPIEMTITELVEAAGKERGPKLDGILTELGRRRGDQALAALGSAASTYDGKTQQLARDLLAKQLSKLNAAKLREKLKDDRAEVRAAAARVVSSKSFHLENELIDLLADEEMPVRQAAHDALVHLSKGTDFGPQVNADEKERKEAEAKWRAWLRRGGP